MIDIESAMTTKVKAACEAVDRNCKVSGEYMATIPQYPFVEFMVTDNYVLRSSISLGKLENHAHIVFEANCYSNLQNGKKLQAKRLLAAVDQVMSDHGFTRRTYSLLPNKNGTVARAFGRWEGIVSDGYTSNGNVLHIIYTF